MFFSTLASAIVPQMRCDGNRLARLQSDTDGYGALFGSCANAASVLG